MSIQVQWDDPEKTIVRWDFNGAWNWDDFFIAQHESNRLLDSVDYVVDVIGNVQNSSRLPPSALTVYRSALNKAAPNMGIIVLVGSNAFIRQMVNIFMRLFRSKGPGTDFRFADTDEQARTLIAEHRADIGLSE